MTGAAATAQGQATGAPPQPVFPLARIANEGRSQPCTVKSPNGYDIRLSSGG